MANQNNAQGQDINQLLKVRREKLANLQEAGQDPFQITKYDVTHHTSDVKDLYNAHEEKLLAGRQLPNTDGMEEAEARAVKKQDYEERRSIMDAEPIAVCIAGVGLFAVYSGDRAVTREIVQVLQPHPGLSAAVLAHIGALGGGVVAHIFPEGIANGPDGQIGGAVIGKHLHGVPLTSFGSSFTSST